MRRTQRQRFLNRVQSTVWVRFYRRCVQCLDDVKRERMHRYRDCDMNGSWWVYLCKTCAPGRACALEYWQEKEKGL